MAGPDPVGAIIDGIGYLLEGHRDGIPFGYSSPFCDRRIERGRFRRVDTDVELAGPQGGAEQRSPFLVSDGGYAGDSGTPTDGTAGSYLYGVHRLVIEIGYGARRQKETALARQMSSDLRAIINTLVEEMNHTLVEGWCGCTVLPGGPPEEAGEGDPAPIRIQVITIEVTYRYYRGV